MKDNIKVSICCMAYNQQDYIENALFGFLSQKTRFDYEIIVHDDCSTDATKEILKAYEKKYPTIFNNIYENANQYSQHKNILNFCLEKAKGDYIAICEGDDYWIDPNKLQRQIDAIEQNEGCICCMHNVKWLNCHTNVAADKIIHIDNTIVDVNSFLTGAVFPYNTCSLLIKKNIIIKMPDWCYEAPVGDIPMQTYALMKGNMIFLKDVMATYRYMAKSSWSVNVVKEDSAQKIINMHRQLIEMYKKANDYSNNKFITSFEYRINKERIFIAGKERDKKILRDKSIRRVFGELSIQEKIVYLMQIYTPKVFKIVRFIWKKLH